MYNTGVLGLSSSTSTMLIDSPDVPALQEFIAKVRYHYLFTDVSLLYLCLQQHLIAYLLFHSNVAVGGITSAITEDVVRVGTLQELVDRVREDRSKKKVSHLPTWPSCCFVRPWLFLNGLVVRQSFLAFADSFTCAYFVYSRKCYAHF